MEVDRLLDVRGVPEGSIRDRRRSCIPGDESPDEGKDEEFKVDELDDELMDDEELDELGILFFSLEPQ